MFRHSSLILLIALEFLCKMFVCFVLGAIKILKKQTKSSFGFHWLLFINQQRHQVNNCSRKMHIETAVFEKQQSNINKQ